MGDSSWLNDRLSQPDYNNWVKGNLILRELKTGLAPFLDEKAKDLQQYVCRHVLASSIACAVCTEKNLKKGTYVCPSGICTTILQDINTAYTHHPPGLVKLMNTDNKAWCNTARYWEIAKAYISTPGYASKTSAAETDCVGLLTIIIKCTWIQSFLAVGPAVFEQIKVARNAMMHSEDSIMSSDELDNLFDDCVKVLQDSPYFAADLTAQGALARIREIKDKTLTLSGIDLPSVMFIINEVKAHQEKDSEAIGNLKVWQQFAEKRMEELAKQQTKHQQEMSQLDTNVSQLDTRVKGQRTEHQQEMSQLGTNVSQLDTRVKRQRTEHQQEMSQLGTNVSQLDTRVKRQCTEHQHEMSQIDTRVKRQHTEHQQEMSQLGTNVSQLDTRVKLQRTEHQQEMSQLGTNVSQLDTRVKLQCTEHQQEMSQLGTNVSQLDTRVKGQRTEHQQEMSHIDTRVKRQHTEHQQEMSQLYSNVSQLDATVSQLDTTVSRQNAENQQAISQLHAHISNIEVRKSTESSHMTEDESSKRCIHEAKTLIKDDERQGYDIKGKIVKKYSLLKKKMEKEDTKKLASALVLKDKITTDQMEDVVERLIPRRRDAVEKLLKHVLGGDSEMHRSFVSECETMENVKVVCDTNLSEKEMDAFIGLELMDDGRCRRPPDETKLTFTDVQKCWLITALNDELKSEVSNDELLSRLCISVAEHTKVWNCEMGNEKRINKLIATMQECNSSVLQTLCEILDSSKMTHITDVLIGRTVSDDKSSDRSPSAILKQESSQFRDSLAQIDLHSTNITKGSITVHLAADSNKWKKLKENCSLGTIRSLIEQLYQILASNGALRIGEHHMDVTIYTITHLGTKEAEKAFLHLSTDVDTAATCSDDGYDQLDVRFNPMLDHYDILVEQLDVTQRLLKSLVENKCLANGDIKETIAIDSRSDQAEHLINKLIAHGQKCYNVLQEHLRVTDKDVFNLLQERDINLKREKFYAGTFVLHVTPTSTPEGDQTTDEVKVTCIGIINPTCHFQSKEGTGQTLDADSHDNLAEEESLKDETTLDQDGKWKAALVKVYASLMNEMPKETAVCLANLLFKKKCISEDQSHIVKTCDFRCEAVGNLLHCVLRGDQKTWDVFKGDLDIIPEDITTTEQQEFLRLENLTFENGKRMHHQEPRLRLKECDVVTLTCSFLTNVTAIDKLNDGLLSKFHFSRQEHEAILNCDRDILYRADLLISTMEQCSENIIEDFLSLLEDVGLDDVVGQLKHNAAKERHEKGPQQEDTDTGRKSLKLKLHTLRQYLLWKLGFYLDHTTGLGRIELIPRDSEAWTNLEKSGEIENLVPLLYNNLPTHPLLQSSENRELSLKIYIHDNHCRSRKFASGRTAILDLIETTDEDTTTSHHGLLIDKRHNPIEMHEDLLLEGIEIASLLGDFKEQDVFGHFSDIDAAGTRSRSKEMRHFLRRLSPIGRKLYNVLLLNVGKNDPAIFHEIEARDKLAAESREYFTAEVQATVRMQGDLKRRKLQVNNPTFHFKLQELDELKNYLINTKYKEEILQGEPNMWFEMKDILQMFVPLEIREDLERWMALTSTERKKVRPGQESDGKKIESWRDIFFKGSERQNKIFLLGEAGVGKSTFCHQLVDNWCRVQDSEPKTDYESVLKSFAFLFFIQARYSDKSETVYKMIKEQLCPLKYHKVLKKLFISHPESCLVLIDGLDEWQSGIRGYQELPNVTEIEGCTILITSRQWRVKALDCNLGPSCRVLEIQGLDAGGIETLAVKVFEAFTREDNPSADCKPLVNQFMGKINLLKLNSFAQIPFLLIILIKSWLNGNNNIENARGFIYSGLIESLLVHSGEKIEHTATSGHRTNTQALPNCFYKKQHCLNYSSLIHELSRLAFEMLFSDEKEHSLVFSKQDLAQQIDVKEHLTLCLKLGLLTETKCFSETKECQRSFSFPHKSIQEYFSSVYLSGEGFNETGFAKFCERVTSPDDLYAVENDLLFLAGMNITHCKTLFDYSCGIVFGRKYAHERLNPDDCYYSLVNVQKIEKLGEQCTAEARHSVPEGSHTAESQLVIPDMVVDEDTTEHKVEQFCSLGLNIKSLVYKCDLFTTTVTPFSVVESIRTMQHIQRLGIGCTAENTEKYIVCICKYLSNLHQLKSFSFSVDGYSPVSLPIHVSPKLVSKLDTLPNLVSVYLKCIDLSDINTCKFTSQLTSLGLWDTKSLSPGVMSGWCNQLHTLYMWNVYLSPAAVHKLRQYLMTSSSLQYLTLNLPDIYTPSYPYTVFDDVLDLTSQTSLHTLTLRYIDLKSGVRIHPGHKRRKIHMYFVSMSESMWQECIHHLPTKPLQELYVVLYEVKSLNTQTLSYIRDKFCVTYDRTNSDLRHITFNTKH